MSKIKPMWRQLSAWHGIAEAGRYGIEAGKPGVVVEPLHAAEMIGLMGRHGAGARIAVMIRQRYRFDLPSRPAAVSGPGFEVIWSAPNQWFAFSRSGKGLAELERTISDDLAIVGQTGARAVMHVSGQHWRRALAKGCPLDLHPSEFSEGHAAATAISLIGVNLWRLPGDDGLHVSVFRSMAGSFWHWLRQSSEEFGLQVLAEP